jgi:ribosome-interacting GTPase 1
MPANLPPDYYAAEERFRQAKTAEEKIRILEEMLAIMPKHKGTDHLKADLRAKISRLEKEGLKKKGTTTRFNPYAIQREDCPQVTMVGLPNSGKSSLLNALTGATSEVGEYPYTTTKPFPGIFRYNHYRFQLVDLPPVVGESMEGWMGDIVRHSEGVMVVLDASQEATLEQAPVLFKAIDRSNIFLTGLYHLAPPLGTIPKSAIIVLSKYDIALSEVVDLLKAEYGKSFRIIETSAMTNTNALEVSRELANTLRILRIFTKIPGKKADMVEPYIVREGINVIELAETVHRDLALSFKFARIWGKRTFDGQKVGKEHILYDEDVVELHS